MVITDNQGMLQDSDFLKELRRQMIRFALLQLRDEQTADDVVQETLAAALKNADRFAGRAALKTWVFAILKNKISDSLRQRYRSPLTETDVSDDTDIEALLFDTHGHWQSSEQPSAWRNPDAAIQDAHFWRVFDACLDHLPPEQGRVFMMREFIEMNSQDICEVLDITVSNLNVMLHRARLRLRRCLEKNWFE